MFKLLNVALLHKAEVYILYFPFYYLKFSATLFDLDL